MSKTKEQAMTNKAPTTRRGIYLTNLQWADAKAAGDGNYSAGVRLCMDDREALAKRNDDLAARLTDRMSRRNKVEAEVEALEAEKVERDATIERYIDANGELVLQVDNLTVERDTLNRDCVEQQQTKARATRRVLHWPAVCLR